MSIDVAYLGSNIAMISAIVVAVGIMVFVITKGRHPSQASTTRALAKACAAKDRLERELADEVELNRNFAGTLHEAAHYEELIIAHERSIAELREKRERCLRDGSLLVKSRHREEEEEHANKS